MRLDSPYLLNCKFITCLSSEKIGVDCDFSIDMGVELLVSSESLVRLKISPAGAEQIASYESCVSLEVKIAVRSPSSGAEN